MFFKIKPGLWALTAERARVSKQFGIATQLQSPKTADFNHSFYQGLVIEIGNLEGYKTFVPNQDKNKSYLQRKLADVASLQEYPSFTYDSLLRRAKTVDVTWFNERNLPNAFFEVEHAGDIQNSLLKFLEFQDFRIEFHIVADEVRQSEYNTKLNYIAFKPLRRLGIEFYSYERISDWHTRLTAYRLSRELNRL